MYSYLVDDNSEYKKGKGVNKNVAATKSHKFLRDSMNRIQSKDHKIGISLSCFDHKIYIQNNIIKTKDVMN